MWKFTNLMSVESQNQRNDMHSTNLEWSTFRTRVIWIPVSKVSRMIHTNLFMTCKANILMEDVWLGKEGYEQWWSSFGYLLAQMKTFRRFSSQHESQLIMVHQQVYIKIRPLWNQNGMSYFWGKPTRMVFVRDTWDSNEEIRNALKKRNLSAFDWRNNTIRLMIDI